MYGRNRTSASHIGTEWDVCEELAMTADGKYDGTLQMFKDHPGEVNLARLRFLRWLSERDLLEHASAGPSTGEYAGAVEPVSVGASDER
jgi:hypothetical protein